MPAELDPRILRIGIEVAGKLQTYDGLAVTASGTKFANANENECEVKIVNLARSTRDYILTETSPFNSKGVHKRLIVEAGRRSTGASTVFEGDIVSACVTQPPDIGITLKATTASHQKGNVIQRSQPGMCSLRQIAEQVAKDLGLSLNFQCGDKQIGNYSFTGGALRQVDQLGSMGAVNAYVDDRALIVKNYGEPLAGPARVVNNRTGMIGIPEYTERGIKVKMLYDNQTRVGSGLRVESELNPGTNGDFSVYKLGFELASHDTPFYLIAEATRLDGAVPGKLLKVAKVVTKTKKK